jgi:hypothetical protein
VVLFQKWLGNRQPSQAKQKKTIKKIVYERRYAGFGSIRREEMVPIAVIVDN